MGPAIARQFGFAVLKLPTTNSKREPKDNRTNLKPEPNENQTNIQWKLKEKRTRIERTSNEDQASTNEQQTRIQRKSSGNQAKIERTSNQHQSRIEPMPWLPGTVLSLCCGCPTRPLSRSIVPLNGSDSAKQVFRLCLFYLFHPHNQHSRNNMYLNSHAWQS